MKSILNSCQAAVLTAIIATPAFADGVGSEAFDVDAAFGGKAPALTSLDSQAMEATRGRLPLLAIPLTIAGVDIGLSAFFWGVYVPNYGSVGSCTGCDYVVYEQ